jgi:hypothetical protein
VTRACGGGEPRLGEEESTLKPSTNLTILGVVATAAFVMHSLQEGRRRAIPRLIGLALVIAAVLGFVSYR